MPIASYLASTVVLRAALALFAVVTIVVFAATIFFVPSAPVNGRMSYGSQLRILRKSVLRASLLATAAINGAMFGFYSFMSDFFGSVSGMDASWVSIALSAYGGANIVGNVIFGHALGAYPKATLVTMLLVLVALHLVLFVLWRLRYARVNRGATPALVGGAA